MIKKTMSEASTNWNVYIKECQEVASTSVTPYKIIPYKNGTGIKQAIVEKQTKDRGLLQHIAESRQNWVSLR
jgi:hypothetical protein